MLEQILLNITGRNAYLKPDKPPPFMLHLLTRCVSSGQGFCHSQVGHATSLLAAPSRRLYSHIKAHASLQSVTPGPCFLHFLKQSEYFRCGFLSSPQPGHSSLSVASKTRGISLYLIQIFTSPIQCSHQVNCAIMNLALRPYITVLAYKRARRDGKNCAVPERATWVLI